MSLEEIMKEMKGICDTWESRVAGMESKWAKEKKEMEGWCAKEIREIKEKMNEMDKER